MKQVFRIAAALALSHFAFAPARAQPQESFAPGVRVGADLVEKKQLFACAPLGGISDLVLGRASGMDRDMLIVAGSKGFAVIDPETSVVERTVEFQRTLPKGLSGANQSCRIIDVDGDGQLEFVRLAEHWIGRTSVHGVDGKVKWTHPGGSLDQNTELAPNFTRYGDLDGDGKLEFLMGFNATDDVHLIGHDGRLIWSQPWGSSLMDTIQFVDVNADGKRDIVYVDGKALWARDIEGKALAETKLPDGGFVNALEIVSGLGQPPKDWLLVGHHVKGGQHAGQNYHLVAFDAKSVGDRVEWNEVEPLLDSKGLAFPDEVAFTSARITTMLEQAPVAGYSKSRLRLRLFDANKRVCYEEIIAPQGKEVEPTEGALLFIPATSARPARLLLGAYGSAVWEYVPGGAKR